MLKRKDAELTILISRLIGRSPHDVYTALGEAEIVVKTLMNEYATKHPFDLEFDPKEKGL